jgi:hypothetical protein
MNEAIHPLASHNLPSFITAPGQTDVLMVVLAFILLLSVVGFGTLYLRLHSLPEHVAHKSQKIQYEFVAILGLISLFTHMHIFWIIGLLLAFIDLPDFGSPLNRIAGSAEKLAGLKPGEGAAGEVPSQTAAGIDHAGEEARLPQEAHGGIRPADAASPTKPELASAKQKERMHA